MAEGALAARPPGRPVGGGGAEPSGSHVFPRRCRGVGNANNRRQRPAASIAPPLRRRARPPPPSRRPSTARRLRRRRRKFGERCEASRNRGVNRRSLAKPPCRCPHARARARRGGAHLGAARKLGAWPQHAPTPCHVLQSAAVTLVRAIRLEVHPRRAGDLRAKSGQLHVGPLLQVGLPAGTWATTAGLRICGGPATDCGGTRAAGPTPARASDTPLTLARARPDGPGGPPKSDHIDANLVAICATAPMCSKQWPISVDAGQRQAIVALLPANFVQHRPNLANFGQMRAPGQLR